jgi:hypothetical protein
VQKRVSQFPGVCLQPLSHPSRRLFTCTESGYQLDIPKGFWLKTRFANLVRYVPSGIHFSRIRVRGKLIRRSLNTNNLAVAQFRQSDLKKPDASGVNCKGRLQSAT